jgi:hypothetical protein
MPVERPRRIRGAGRPCGLRPPAESGWPIWTQDSRLAVEPCRRHCSRSCAAHVLHGWALDRITSGDITCLGIVVHEEGRDWGAGVTQDRGSGLEDIARYDIDARLVGVA